MPDEKPLPFMTPNPDYVPEGTPVVDAHKHMRFTHWSPEMMENHRRRMEVTVDEEEAPSTSDSTADGAPDGN